MTIHKDLSKPSSMYVCVSTCYALLELSCFVCLVEALWGETTLLGVWNPDKKQIHVLEFLSCCYLGDYLVFYKKYIGRYSKSWLTSGNG